MGGLSDRILDRLLVLTTSRARPGIGADKGWTIRRAGPRWFAIWDGDRGRLRRLRVLLLPADWLSLSAAQEAALALEQLRPAAEMPAQLCLPLREARARLRRALSRRL
ncbi:hypothetical protein [Paracoccus binzhouensis]|uniref:hypothetical protein n=1 Tax=Paracoccus binzhouensis TaxID=2796149 RepID=UPI0018EEF852|nr:hypothetical protein [Paracoccus binzhouensis]